MPRPENAIPLPPPGGPFPTQRAELIQSIIDECTREDAGALATFQHACSDWRIANERNRAMGLALTPKPTQPVRQVVKTETPANPDAGIIYLWLETGDPLGSPCPDLPALPPPPSAGHIHIGHRIYGPWFTAEADDRYSADNPPTTSQADDGTTGIFQRYPSPVGNGWWKLLT